MLFKYQQLIFKLLRFRLIFYVLPCVLLKENTYLLLALIYVFREYTNRFFLICQMESVTDNLKYFLKRGIQMVINFEKTQMVQNELDMNSVTDGENRLICECAIIQMEQQGEELRY